MTTVSKAVTMQRSRNDEVIGKVFIALGRGMRQCLICDGAFTKQGAAAHAGTVCNPPKGNSELDGEDQYANW